MITVHDVLIDLG